jgi:hypothetical protein
MKKIQFISLFICIIFAKPVFCQGIAIGAGLPYPFLGDEKARLNYNIEIEPCLYVDEWRYSVQLGYATQNSQFSKKQQIFSQLFYWSFNINRRFFHLDKHTVSAEIGLHVNHFFNVSNKHIENNKTYILKSRDNYFGADRSFKLALRYSFALHRNCYLHIKPYSMIKYNVINQTQPGQLKGGEPYFFSGRIAFGITFQLEFLLSKIGLDYFKSRL